MRDSPAATCGPPADLCAPRRARSLLNEKYAGVPFERHWEGIIQASKRHMPPDPLALTLTPTLALTLPSDAPI
eukprot:3885424-Prymnesium_polylepis.1